MDCEPGTLPRLIGLIERRGFEVLALELSASGGARQASLEVEPLRRSGDVGVLSRQIERLYGITCLESSCSEHSLSLRHRFPLVG
jgi:acetolactate synthase regulatory subunit